MQTYLIANGPPAIGTQVKIGRSEDVESRLRQLQTASSKLLILLITIDGDRELEFHRRFSDNRQIGEWFAWTQEMQDFIDRGCYELETDLFKLLDPDGTIHCPFCRFFYHHFDSPPEINDGNYDMRTTKQIRIRMDGECGHTWWLTLECRKGIASLSVGIQ